MLRVLLFILAAAMLLALMSCTGTGSGDGFKADVNLIEDINREAASAELAEERAEAELYTPEKSDETEPERICEYTTLNEFEGVTLGIKDGSLSPDGATLIITNDRDTEYLYGSFYCIEKKDREVWTELKYIIDNVGWTAEGYPLPAKQAAEQEVNWVWAYGSLEPGEYRIIKDFLDVRKPGDYDKYYISAEFTING